jgi:hypothetical protein
MAWTKDAPTPEQCRTGDRGFHLPIGNCPLSTGTSGDRVVGYIVSSRFMYSRDAYASTMWIYVVERLDNMTSRLRLALIPAAPRTSS